MTRFFAGDARRPVWRQRTRAGGAKLTAQFPANLLENSRGIDVRGLEPVPRPEATCLGPRSSGFAGWVLKGVANGLGGARGMVIMDIKRHVPQGRRRVQLTP